MAEQLTDYPLDYSKSRNGSADRMKDDTRAQLKSAADNAQDFAQQIGEQARQYGEKAQDIARNFKPFMEKSMKEQPMTTLAAAAAVAFVLGALWRK